MVIGLNRTYHNASMLFHSNLRVRLNVQPADCSGLPKKISLRVPPFALSTGLLGNLQSKSVLFGNLMPHYAGNAPDFCIFLTQPP
jgi:hypothetical protein